MPRRSRTSTALGIGATAVVALALAAPPALAGPAAAPDPVPSLVAGQDTAAPQLVTGLAEPAVGSPADAARAHLAAHADRYHVDPGELAEVGSESTADGRRTVRFEQRHDGVPVFGAQYLVHLTGEGAGQRVESVGGKYFTGLTAPTTATVPAAALRDLALGSVQDPKARAAATAEDHGLVVLPDGAGRLAQRFTVHAADPATGAPAAREVFVDATVGVVALAYDTRAPLPTGGNAGSAADGSAAAGLEPATGTAPDAHGNSAKVNIARLPDGSYQLTDLTRPAAITTYDAGGRDEMDFGGAIPADLPPAHSPGPDFPASAGTSGATDASVNAGIVYDFYHDRFGRNGLDGKGGAITSVVNVTQDGAPYANAYWDGKKMVYGSGGPNYYPFSAALDIAGHEMTHGVISNTADLAGMGQAGAMNEGIADYFGNAIEVTARGMSMNDPAAALLGESKCRTGTPQACADRRMDDHRTTVDDYLGGTVDNGGQHLNATIFSGALWDVRRTLDPLTADRVVYRALTAYLTPLDDFVAGRNAALAAGRDLGLSHAQLRTVAAAFDAHGIKPGWENRIGMDSRTLARNLSYSMAPPAAGGGHWVAMAPAPDPVKGTGGTRPDTTALYTGSTTGRGAPVRLSPDDGRYHSWPATDGTTAVWKAIGTTAQNHSRELLAAPLSGAGPVRSLFLADGTEPGSPQVSGGDIAFTVNDFTTHRTSIRLSHDGAPAVELPLADGHHPDDLTLKDGYLAWTESWQDGQQYVTAPTVYSIAAGKVTAQYTAHAAPGAATTTASSARLAGGRLLWLDTPAGATARSSIRSGALDGSGVTEVLAADSPNAPTRGGSLASSDQAVTYKVDGTKPAGGWTNAALPKLWQLPTGGGTPQRLSCDRGGQDQPAADQGTRVVWLDSTPGRTDLVVRDRAAGTC
ncbi:M4 family metallopeptidase [Kitasatospora sp. NPDC091276]|uniref:M4 family metallopeptidase n=1 Tax=Kitasatospora sp. NPDC091276 TaxID=3155300 RepID=UPI00343527E3